MNSRKTTAFSPTGFFYNGAVSALSSLALRFAGMIFNVYLSANAGAQAMGLLSLVYSAWGFVLTADCAGGGLASARMCAESASRNENEHAACRKCLTYSLVCASLIAFVFLAFIPSVAQLLSDSRTVTPLRLLAFSLPFVSMSGVLSGYFNAIFRSYLNSGCMIIEQIVRISLTVFIFSKFNNADAGDYCTAIIFGGVCADIISFILQYTVFIIDRRNKGWQNSACSVTFGKIASITLPVGISASIRSGLVSLEHILIPKGLHTFGYSRKEALSLFGTVHGMAIPVILFCISIPSAFSVLMIPRFAEHNALNNKKEIRYIESRAYRTALIFSFGVASYLTLSAYLLGNELYPGTDAAKYIYIFAPLVPVMYVDSVSDAILKGLGEQLYSMKINIADAVISVACVFLLVPHIGIYGYVIAIYVSEAFNTCASMVRVMKLTGYTVPIIRHTLVPLIMSVIAANVTGVFYRCVNSLANSLTLILGGFVYTFIFILLLWVSKNLTREELGYFAELIVKKKKIIPNGDGDPG